MPLSTIELCDRLGSAIASRLSEELGIRIEDGLGERLVTESELFLIVVGGPPSDGALLDGAKYTVKAKRSNMRHYALEVTLEARFSGSWELDAMNGVLLDMLNKYKVWAAQMTTQTSYLPVEPTSENCEGPCDDKIERFTGQGAWFYTRFIDHEIERAETGDGRIPEDALENLVLLSAERMRELLEIRKSLDRVQEPRADAPESQE